jgi:retinol dehydrogenase-8
MRNLAKKDALEKAAGSALNKNLFIRELDVCNSDSVTESVQKILKEEGKIDVLVNNAGVGLSAPIECLSVEQAKENFETNFFGVYRMIQAVLPSMKEKKSGQIIQISSMGGIRGVPFNDVYCAAKFAVEGLTESLAPTLRCWNISISLIEPGPIFTDFVANALQQSQGGDVDAFNVDARTKEVMKVYKQKMMAGFTPQIAETAVECAEKVKGVIESANPPFRLQTNKNYLDFARAKLVDITGNSGVDQQFNMFFSTVV